ncbi:hypothetical protein BC833DRAFT_622015 [Globomyces pollinis-pini]|nr:hypothetical protein BC833DRAFT_622015 [Globomyces pollinis-pini]
MNQERTVIVIADGGLFLPYDHDFEPLMNSDKKVGRKAASKQKGKCNCPTLILSIIALILAGCVLVWVCVEFEQATNSKVVTDKPLGCYTDHDLLEINSYSPRNKSRVFQHGYGPKGEWTMIYSLDKCKDWCRGFNQFQYVGLEFGGQCSCGTMSEFLAASVTDDSNCNFVCQDSDKDKYCGGSWSMNIWEL